MGKSENKGIYNKGEKVKLTPNFVSTEFDCHGKECCSQTQIDQKLVDILQNIRDHFNKAVHISSGYRCPIHNKNVGGATGSRHAKGQAADIYIDGVAPAEIAKYAEGLGVKGIGLYETDKDGHFVHVDTRTTKSFWYGQAQAPRTTFGGLEPEPQKPIEPEKNEVKFKAGDLVLLAEDAVYYSGKKIPDWVKKQAWYVKENQVKDRVVIDKSEDGKNNINSPINEKYLILKETATEDKNKLPYLVRVTANRLNYRSGPSMNSRIEGIVNKNQVFTIIEENGDWGKLKSGAGWINLNYTEKI